MKRNLNRCVVGVRALVAAVLTLTASGGTALAGSSGYLTDNDKIPSPSYVMTSPPVTFAGGYQIHSFFDIFTEISRVSPPPAPQPGGTSSRIDSFFDVFTELRVGLNGLPPGQPVIIGGRQTIQTTFSSASPGLRTFDTEMLQLNLQGLPNGAMIRESPTRASLGRFMIRESPTRLPGNFQIDSFFDVFTELSLDGGQSWIPADNAMRLQGVLPEPASLAAGAAFACVALRRARRNVA